MSNRRLYSGAADSVTAQGHSPSDIARITIRLRSGSNLVITDPPCSDSQQNEEELKVDSPSCFLDVARILSDAARRMTRAAIVEALEAAGRRWSDGSVGKALAQLVLIEAIDNRQDTTPKGYGAFGSE